MFPFTATPLVKQATFSFNSSPLRSSGAGPCHSGAERTLLRKVIGREPHLWRFPGLQRSVRGLWDSAINQCRDKSNEECTVGGTDPYLSFPLTEKSLPNQTALCNLHLASSWIWKLLFLPPPDIIRTETVQRRNTGNFVCHIWNMSDATLRTCFFDSFDSSVVNIVILTSFASPPSLRPAVLNVRKIRPCLEYAVQLLHTFIISHLDYCNALLTGLNQTLNDSNCSRTFHF